MRLQEIFWPGVSDHANELFTNDAIQAVDERLTQKNGKPHLRCFVREKEVAAKPEEIIRQFWLYRLLHRYGYPKNRLRVEYPITFGRDTSKRADIVLWTRTVSTRFTSS